MKVRDSLPLSNEAISRGTNMQNPSGIDGAMSALELLCEQLDMARTEFNQRISEVAKASDYSQVRDLTKKAESLGSFKKKADTLSTEIKEAFGQSVIPSPLTRHSKSLATTSSADGGTLLILTNKCCQARARYCDGSLWVLRGSIISPVERKSLINKWRNLRQRLRDQNDLSIHHPDDALVLGRDIKFKSPSGAACFVVGYSVNGNRSWVVEQSGESFGAWLSSQGTI